MSHFAPSDTAELEAQVLELTVGCPVTHDNPEGCQLHDIRLFSSPACAAWIASQPAQALRQLVTRHTLCMQARMFMQSVE